MPWRRAGGEISCSSLAVCPVSPNPAVSKHDAARPALTAGRTTSSTCRGGHRDNGEVGRDRQVQRAARGHAEHGVVLRVDDGTVPVKPPSRCCAALRADRHRPRAAPITAIDRGASCGAQAGRVGTRSRSSIAATDAGAGSRSKDRCWTSYSRSVFVS